MKKYIEKFVPKDAPNRRSYIEQVVKILESGNNAKATLDYKQQAVALYAPMLINFKNVAIMKNRVDLMANGWVEIMAKLGYKIIVGLVQEEDEININAVGFTKEAPVTHIVKSTTAPTLDNVKQAYCFAYNENNGMFTSVEVITRDELKTIAKIGGNPWRTYPGEMMKKATIRRFTKRLGLDNEQMNTIIDAHDEDHDLTKNTLSEEDALILINAKIEKAETVTELVTLWEPVKKQDDELQQQVIPSIIDRLKEFAQTDIVEKSIVHFENMLTK